jgi:oligosaccharide reducing-end xylanase
VRSISFLFISVFAVSGLVGGCKGSSGAPATDSGLGGSAGNGGAPANGGSVGTDGLASTGGRQTTALGGAGTGGAPSSGGAPASGGAAGASDGGVDVPSASPDGKGGLAGTGGTTATGGASGKGGSGVDGGRACSSPAAYRNLFVEILGKTQTEVDDKLDKMVQQLFHGTSDQKIYYELGTDQAQIYDVNNSDVRTEGQSYGMMMAVQMDMRTEFDKLWRYAATCMRTSNGTFNWSMQQGACTVKQPGCAPDGEEYFAMALLLASRRWDTSTGIDYAAEAKKVLKAIATQNIFGKDPACVYFAQLSGNSDPSYVLPLFYTEWACFDADNAALWDAAATHARKTFFRNACNKQTGLASEHSALDGTPQDDFGPDSWRVPMNIMMDYHLNGADADWQSSYAKTHAAFWVKEGLASYGDRYSLSGEKKNPGHGAGQDGVNALLAFALPAGDANAKALLQRAWDVPMQTGQYRYYNGCLQVMSFLHASGRFKLFSN